MNDINAIAVDTNANDFLNEAFLKAFITGIPIPGNQELNIVLRISKWSDPSNI